jgi:hypothetical protein
MIEIVVLVLVSKRISELMKPKNRKGWPYILLFLAAWIAGELAGGVVGAILFGQSGGQCVVYLVGIAGAIISGGLTFYIIKNLEPLEVQSTDKLEY